MTLYTKVAAATAVVALTFAALAALIPGDATAINAPRCVFNSIVQPFNNGGTTLSWKAYDAHTVSISGIGIVSDADSIVVYPDVTTTYTLTATGNGGTTTCTARAQPVSSYAFMDNRYVFGGVRTPVRERCDIRVSPDLVVPGGTGVLSWDAGTARTVRISPAVGNVASSGSVVVPYSPVPQTYTMTIEYGNGTMRTCSATLRPAHGFGTPTTFASPPFTGGVAVPGVVGAPRVSAVYTQPTVQYVSLAHMPYTGPEDTAYVLGMLAVFVASVAGMFALYRRRFA